MHCIAHGKYARECYYSLDRFFINSPVFHNISQLSTFDMISPLNPFILRANRAPKTLSRLALPSGEPLKQSHLPSQCQQYSSNFVFVWNTHKTLFDSAFQNVMGSFEVKFYIISSNWIRSKLSSQVCWSELNFPPTFGFSIVKRSYGGWVVGMVQEIIKRCMEA